MSNQVPLPAEVDIQRLLADLSSKLGFSFAAREPRHFAMLAARDRNEFIDEVLVAEGLEPEFHQDLRTQVGKLVGGHCMAVSSADLKAYSDKSGPGKRGHGTLHLPAKRSA